jgi:hypothetical protein
MLIKTDVPGLYKNNEGALINKNNKGLALYKQSKAKAKKLEALFDDVDQLKKDMSEIKELLIKALNK